MAKKFTFKQLQQKGKTIAKEKLTGIKGGYTQFTLPGRELRAGTWTEIDLRARSNYKRINRLTNSNELF